jgi:two-component system, cell cycle sensor histidine kinase and response regulator CckA
MTDRGGVLEVELAKRVLEHADLHRYPELKPWAYFELTVSDTGCGMSREILDRIFDPYFSTKLPDKGSGLGLSVVHGIVRAHEGAIRAYSEPGKGTTFHVLLPKLKAETLSEPEVARLPVATRPAYILFIDDEAGLADYGKQMLEHLGHKVVTGTSSMEALEAFRTQPDKFDLVITDMTMPRMTGADLSMELLRIRPDIPIILCTGYSEKITVDKARAMGIREMLMKPVLIRNMADAIAKVLGDSDK